MTPGAHLPRPSAPAPVRARPGRPAGQRIWRWPQRPPTPIQRIVRHCPWVVRQACGLGVIKMDQVVSWKGLMASAFPKGEGGRPTYTVAGYVAGASDTELIRLQQSSDGRGPLRDHDPAPVVRLHADRIFVEATTLNFRRLLEKHELTGGVLQVINGSMGDRGCCCAKAQWSMRRPFVRRAQPRTRTLNDPQIHQTQMWGQPISYNPA